MRDWAFPDIHPREVAELPQFQRYIGIDYSGAESPDSSCKGLRVYLAEDSGEPIQVQPPPSPRRYWTRRGLAEWLCEKLGDETPSIVGIDHAFSFPLAYFERYRLSSDWPTFLVDFRRHWPTDDPGTYIDFIRDGNVGEGFKRMGDTSWLRLTERWTATAKSVAAWLQRADLSGSLNGFLSPSLTAEELGIARIEGWILGVV
jgi:hypothetical protein